MTEILARNWRLIVLRGVLSILFGLTILVWKNLTLYVLVVIFGAYALLDGVIAVSASLAHAGSTTGSRIFLLEGLFNMIVGMIALIWPFAAPMSVILLIGVWAILTGILQIIAAISLRQEIRHERLLTFGGLVTVILGVLLFGWPDAMIIAIVWTIGVNTQIFGVLWIALGLLLRRWQMPRGHQPRPV